MKPKNGITYCYMATHLPDDDNQNRTEDNLLRFASTHNIEVTGCFRDHMQTKREGLRTVLKKIETQPPQYLVVPNVEQLGGGVLLALLLELLEKQHMVLLTLSGERDLSKLRPTAPR